MELHNTDISIHELFFLTILVYNKLKEYLIVFVLRKLSNILKYVYQVKSTNASSSKFKDSWKRSNLTNVVYLRHDPACKHP